MKAFLFLFDVEKNKYNTDNIPRHKEERQNFKAEELLVGNAKWANAGKLSVGYLPAYTYDYDHRWNLTGSKPCVAVPGLSVPVPLLLMLTVLHYKHRR